jgi:hypothetical protein
MGIKGVFTHKKKSDISTGTEPSTNDILWLDESNGVVYSYDANRSKWLSTNRIYTEFLRNGKADGIYLPIYGDLDTNEDCFVPCYDSTIIGIYCRSKAGNVNKIFNILINDTLVYQFNYEGDTAEYSNLDLNINIDKTDKLKMYVTRDGLPTVNPHCRLETAWRYDQ